MKTTQIKIEDMSCEACAAGTQRALQSIGGVHAVNVNLPAGQATVEHGDEVAGQTLLDAVIDAGFEARIEKS